MCRTIRNTRFWLMFVLLGSLVLTSCKKDDDPENSDTNILGRTWVLESVQHTKSNSISYFPEIKESVSIEFHENKTLIINGICNTGSGNYAIINDQITFTELKITKVLCDNANWEDITLTSLQYATSFKISEGKLFIYSSENYNLIFE